MKIFNKIYWWIFGNPFEIKNTGWNDGGMVRNMKTRLLEKISSSPILCYPDACYVFVDGKKINYRDGYIRNRREAHEWALENLDYKGNKNE